MKPLRRKRLTQVLFLLIGSAITIGLFLMAAEENMNTYYPPEKIVAGVVPIDIQIRAGGMVLENSIERGKDSLAVNFIITNYEGAEFKVRYDGILPDLFKEGSGVLATGVLHADGVFEATQILAKHDENYMPPELLGMETQQQ